LEKESIHLEFYLKRYEQSKFSQNPFLNKTEKENGSDGNTHQHRENVLRGGAFT